MDAQVTAALVSGGAALTVAVLGIGGAIAAQLFTTRHAFKNSLALQEQQYAKQEQERQEQSRREDAYRFAEQRRSTYGRFVRLAREFLRAVDMEREVAKNLESVSIRSVTAPRPVHTSLRYPPRPQSSWLRMRGNEHGGFMANSVLHARRSICWDRRMSGGRLTSYGRKRTKRCVPMTKVTLRREARSWKQRVTNSGSWRTSSPCSS